MKKLIIVLVITGLILVGLAVGVNAAVQTAGNIMAPQASVDQAPVTNLQVGGNVQPGTGGLQ